jgi:hypothetical protein
MEKGYGFWPCHRTKKVSGTEIVVNCHTKYHIEKKLFGSTGRATTESSAISDLTEE